MTNILNRKCIYRLESKHLILILLRVNQAVGQMSYIAGCSHCLRSSWPSQTNKSNQKTKPICQTTLAEDPQNTNRSQIVDSLKIMKPPLHHEEPINPSARISNMERNTIKNKIKNDGEKMDRQTTKFQGKLGRNFKTLDAERQNSNRQDTIAEKTVKSQL